ncbi:MAG: alanine racemase [bacterium]
MERLSTWVEVDLDVLASNLRRLRELVGPRVQLQLVVKADAYGHGATAVARVAQEQGAHSVGVATIDEGVELRAHGIGVAIVVLSPTLPSEAQRAVDHRLTLTLGNVETARALSAASAAAGVLTSYHVEIDTGMGRSGIAPSRAVEFLRAVSELPGLRLEGVFTHFPRADAGDGGTQVERQIEDFLEVADALRAAGIDPGLLHAANSAALVRHPRTRLDLVRPGILAYGLPPSEGVAPPPGIAPVMRFVTRLVHVREMPPAHPISYGGDFVTPEAMRVGTGAVGYGHGYPWALSGRGAALLRGRRVPILGRVTMDTTVFDLRGVPEARLGDEIVLFGRQGDEEIRVSDLASLSATLPYEILIGIGRRVPRVYTRTGRAVQTRTLLGLSRSPEEA